MTALSKIPPPVLAAVLGIGALWFLNQRRAVAGSTAGGGIGAPKYGTQRAIGDTDRNYTGPSGILPRQSPVQAALQFASTLFGGRQASAQNAPAAERQGGPSTGFYGSPTNPSFVSPGQIVRPDDYQPIWTPDTQGEISARQYYLDNVDQFAAQPSPILTSGYAAGTDGWLDNQ